MSNTRQLAKTLPCLFKDIVDKYPESQLRPCKTDSQTWKHASAPAAVVRINKLAKYFPELSLLNNCLEDYSICVNHYNQIVATNNFYQSLLNSDPSNVSSIQKNKRVIFAFNYYFYIILFLSHIHLITIFFRRFNLIKS